MTVTRHEVRAGAYYDSIVLMQLQKGLAALPGVEDAGVVMATEANREVLAASGFDVDAIAAQADDLLIVVQAATAAAADGALAQVDGLLKQRRSDGGMGSYRPKSLAAAAKMLPQADWVLVSVPGRYAAGVAGDALDLGKHVFLYSDNVSIDDELRLKRKAQAKGLLVMGPDCGTALVNGIGLGFANRVRRGNIGVVAASGTGLQAVTAHIHNLGGGVSHGLGTGGRDLKDAIGGITARQALALLDAAPDTHCIVLISKPPSPAVSQQLLAAARRSSKPVVVYFIGRTAPAPRFGNLHFAQSLSHAAALAVEIGRVGEWESERVGEWESGRVGDWENGRVGDWESERVGDWENGRVGDWESERVGDWENGRVGEPSRAIPQSPNLPIPQSPNPPIPQSPNPLISQSPPRHLRALFSGGTLAYEAVLMLQGFVAPLHTNVPVGAALALDNPLRSLGHTIVDLGEDDFTQGRLHPMLDNDLRIRRLREEAADPEVGVILLDVVLGDGAHPDPASELAPVIEEIGRTGERQIMVLVIGTDDDPQDRQGQIERFSAAGARVFTDPAPCYEAVVAALGAGSESETGRMGDSAPPIPQSPNLPIPQSPNPSIPQSPNPLSRPFAAINVGLESFYDSLADQGAPAIHIEWRPPAGGNERMMALLARLKGK